METKEVIVGERKFIVKELKAIQLDDINFEDRKSAVKMQVQLSTGLNDEDYNNLTVKERGALLRAIDELNFHQTA